MPLRPHQVEPAAALLSILRQHQSAVDISDMGIGKTAHAVSVIAESGLPTLVIVPKIAISGWKTMLDNFNTSASLINYESLRTGKTPFGSWERSPGPSEVFFQCTHCQRKYKAVEIPDRCYCRDDGVHCFETKRKPRLYGKFIFHPAVKQVVFDEIHRCSALDSLNADMLIAARRQGLKILGLSATVASSPLHLRALGYALNLHSLQDFYSWAARFGVRRIPGAGFKWMVASEKQGAIMANIRASIIPARGVRVTTDSIPGFPECDVTAELYDLDSSPGQIDALYAEMAEAITELKLRGSFDKDSEHPLTKYKRAHQTIELLKVPLMQELAEDYLAKGFSVALFVNYSQTMTEIRKRLKIDCFVDGSPEGVRYRQRSIERFQANSARAIALNSDAGGICISLEDKIGTFPRVGLVMPNPSATIMRQVFGRLRRDGGKSRSHYRVLLAAGTLDTKVHRSLSAKLNNLDSLNDADLRPENLLISV
jgi:hypothetical protein